GVGITDAVWGDARLDPLQFTLLYYALRRPASATQGHGLRAAVSSQPETAAQALTGEGLSLGHGVKAVGMELVLDLAGKILKWPVTPFQNLSQAVCAPIYLFCHKVSLTLDPEVIY